MKKKWIITALVTAICVPGHTQQSPAKKSGPCLLSTNWSPDGVFARFSPNGQHLGSRSVALAQILYYHSLQPQGVVNYTCSNGTAVNIDFSANKYDFKNMATDSNAIASYSYAVAAAAGRDFDAARYLQTFNPAARLQQFFKCEADFYAGFNGVVPYTTSELMQLLDKEKITRFADQNAARSLVKTEIDARRPLYFCYGNWSGFEQAVVIDGYIEEADSFWIHINYGRGGYRNGWYRMNAPVDIADDMLLRNYMTIRPQQKRLKQILNKYINPFKAGGAGN